MPKILEKAILEKAKHIRLVIFDVDGVLTTGELHYGQKGNELKIFHVHDGQGMKFLLQTGVQIGIITARHSDMTTQRMDDLGITYVYQDQADKVVAYEDLKQKLKLTDQQIAYIGDDLADLPLIRRAGLGITVANGIPILQQHAAWVTKAKGGEGAAREVCELIMQAQGSYQTIIQSYLDR